MKNIPIEKLYKIKTILLKSIKSREPRVLKDSEIVNKNQSWSSAQYLKSFGWISGKPEESLTYNATSRLAKAYETALDIRKFEIELYWKRSNSFWLLITAISTALGLLATSSNSINTTGSILNTHSKEIACLILALAANMLCAGWLLANIASKFWQHNWERQVDILEQELVGPLYKTVFSSAGNFSKKSYFSVSDVNKFSSIYLLIIFTGLSFYFSGIPLLFDFKTNTEFSATKTIIILANLLFAGTFWFCVEVRTKEKTNALDIEVEAAIRRVTVSKKNSSSNGDRNLSPGSDTKTISEYFWENCGTVSSADGQ